MVWFSKAVNLSRKLTIGKLSLRLRPGVVLLFHTKVFIIFKYYNTPITVRFLYLSPYVHKSFYCQFEHNASITSSNFFQVHSKKG